MLCEALEDDLNLILEDKSLFTEVATRIVRDEDKCLITFVAKFLKQFERDKKMNQDIVDKFCLCQDIAHRFEMGFQYLGTLVSLYKIGFFTFETCVEILEKYDMRETYIAEFPDFYHVKYEVVTSWHFLFFLSKFFTEEDIFLFEKYHQTLAFLEIIARKMKMARLETETTSEFITRFLRSVSQMRMDEKRFRYSFDEIASEVIKRYPPKIYDPKQKVYRVYTKIRDITPGCYFLPEADCFSMTDAYIGTFLKRFAGDLYIRVEKDKFIRLNEDTHFLVDFHSEASKRTKKDVITLKAMSEEVESESLKKILLDMLSYDTQEEAIIKSTTLRTQYFDYLYLIK